MAGLSDRRIARAMRKLEHGGTGPRPPVDEVPVSAAPVLGVPPCSSPLDEVLAIAQEVGW